MVVNIFLSVAAICNPNYISHHMKVCTKPGVLAGDLSCSLEPDQEGIHLFVL